MPASRNGQPRGRENSGGLIQKGKMDIAFLAIVLIILTIGLVMLFSASHFNALELYGSSYHFISRQLIFAVPGVVIMLLVSKINYQVLRRLYIPWILFFASVVLLIVILLLPPMSEGFDYKRWFYFGGITFQPSEIAKFAVVLLFAHLISLNYRKMKTFTFGFLLFVVLLVCVCGLVVVEPHLSATILIFLIGVVLMVVGGTRFAYIGGAGVIGVVLALGAILSGHVDYGADRFKYWLDPFADPKGKGYQIIQSLYAIGSGGFLGRGIGSSRQKYLWVPEPQNDFIFPIVVEELGFVGGAIIIILYALLVWRGFTIAMRAPDKFGSLLAIGLSLQAAFNILVVTNTIPNTGISLPFFSYGGTSLLMLLAQMGVVLSISRASSLKKS